MFICLQHIGIYQDILGYIFIDEIVGRVATWRDVNYACNGFCMQVVTVCKNRTDSL